MTINIDRDTCIGCGRCTEVCPDTFKLDEMGKSTVIGANPDCAQSAADQCPVSAITISE